MDRPGSARIHGADQVVERGIERGRRSGLIAPAFGESGTRGRYLTHLGYYWAMTEYTDINFRTDLYAVGMVLYVLSSVSKVPFERIARATFPDVLLLIGVLMLITYVPDLVTFVPNLFFGP